MCLILLNENVLDKFEINLKKLTGRFHKINYLRRCSSKLNTYQNTITLLNFYDHFKKIYLNIQLTRKPTNDAISHLHKLILSFNERLYLVLKLLIRLIWHMHKICGTLVD